MSLAWTLKLQKSHYWEQFSVVSSRQLVQSIEKRVSRMLSWYETAPGKRPSTVNPEHKREVYESANRTFFHTLKRTKFCVLMRTLERLRKRKSRRLWKRILASYTPRTVVYISLPSICNPFRCGSVACVWVSVKMWSVRNNLWTESPDFNTVTTSGWSSYHAHLNVEFYCL